MRHCLEMLLTTALLVTASISIGQERSRPYAPDSDVLARLSYDVSGVVLPGNVRHACIAVSRDGEYRIERWTALEPIERLHGKMPKEEFNRLSELLGATELRSLSGYHGGVVRQEAETFGAEVPVGDRSHLDGAPQQPDPAWRLQWMNGDGRNPFPASVSRLVNWIKRFQPKDGNTFEYTDYPEVCPTAGLRLLHPSVAQKLHP